MDAALFHEVVSKPERESERSHFPQGFPDPIDVPAARYSDPEFYDLEQVHVFSKSWQFVACTDQIPKKGDYRLLDVLTKPLFLIRGDDEVVRCFYNTCQHRGSALLTEPAGNAGTLVCPFHAWTYGREGELRGYPEAKNYPRNADKDCLHLKSVRCETFGTLIFINLDQNACPLREFLGPVAEELDTLIGDKSQGVHFFSTNVTWVDANWKHANDANIETYHVPFLHKETAHPGIDSERTGQWLLPHGHSRMMIKFRPEVAKIVAEQATAFPKFSGLESNALSMEGVYSFHLFPNTSIVMTGPSLFFVISAVPHRPNRFAYVTTFLGAAEPNGAWHDVLSALVDTNLTVLGEDLAVMTSQQRSIDCGALDVLKLQYQERRIRKLHEDIDRWIGVENVPDNLRVPPRLDEYVEPS